MIDELNLSVDEADRIEKEINQKYSHIKLSKAESDAIYANIMRQIAQDNLTEKTISIEKLIDYIYLCLNYNPLFDIATLSVIDTNHLLIESPNGNKYQIAISDLKNA